MSTSPQDFNAQMIEGLITAHLAATFAGLPVYVHTIEHADGVVLVDTGMLDSTPELDEECEPVPMPENIPRDVVRVINTHLHFEPLRRQPPVSRCADPRPAARAASAS